MNETPGAALPLQTLEDNNKPPKARLASASDAQNMFWQFKLSAEPRLRKAAIIQAMFDGNPPYDPAKRRNHGQGGLANFNTLEGAARKDAAKTPFHDLFSSASAYAQADTDISTENLDAATASRIRSEYFDQMQKGWSSFEPNMWMMLNDFISFNRGFLWHPDTDSWHFKHVPWHKIFFPDGTSIDPENWEVFAIEHSWPVHKLYGFVRDSELAKAAGWNVDQVYEAIRQAVPKTVSRGSGNDPLQIQQALRDSELYVSSMSATVQSASIYTREFDGTWTRMMVQTEGQRRNETVSSMSPEEAFKYQIGETSGKGSKLKRGDWLFWKQKVGKCIHEIIHPFIFESGEGSINSIDGLGKKLVSVMQLKDRMRNAQADNVMMRSNVILQAQTGATQAKAGQITMNSGVSVLPPGFLIQNSTIFGDIEGTLAVNADLDRMIDTNTGIYRPQFEKPQGNPETATAANIRFGQSTVLTSSAVNRFYLQLDRFYAEIYRRASMDLPKSSDPGIRSARKFQKQCRDAGLSKEQIQDISYEGDEDDNYSGTVTAVRAIGNGSPIMRQQVAGSLSQIVPFLGPRGLQAWKEMFISAWGGQHAVARLLPKEDRAEVPGRDDYDAVGENADAQTGAPILIAPWQNHEIHAKVHLTAGFAAIQAVGSGADPSMPFAFLQEMLPHIAQHIQAIARENVRKQMTEAFSELQKQSKQVEQAAQAQAQQKQLGNQLSFEQQIKAQEFQGKMQLQNVKAEQAFRIKKAKALQDMAIVDARTKQELSTADARTAHEINLGTARTVAEIRSKKAKEGQQNAK